MSAPRPGFLEGRSLLDSAGFLVAEAGCVALRDAVAPYGEEHPAGRGYLGALFPDATPAELDDAWARARALDAAATRHAMKEYGYPGHEKDDPPPLAAACPGFSDDVYVRAHGNALHALR